MPQKDKRYAVEVTESAREMLLTHARFLANVSIPAANAMIDTFVEQTDRLSSMPERCPWLEDSRIPFRRYRKLPFGKYYMALYEIREDIVYITAVVDCRQEYEWLIP